MNWTEVNIYTSTLGIDAVCDNLMQLGITGFVIQDAKDFEEFLENKTGNWDYIDDDLLKLKSCESCVTVYLADNMQGGDTLTALRLAMERLGQSDEAGAYGRLEISLANVREEDWANNWRQYFKPFEVGERLIVKPTWESCENPSGRHILEIDPASSFGTGQHHTTRLCMEELEHCITNGCTVLDMGCGSGILSIAALLLGAGTCVAIDIDENSVRIAKENVTGNGITDEQFTAYCGNVLLNEHLQQTIGSKCYDVIVANIVADVIIAMSELFPKFLKPGGVLITSGIITERADEVIAALGQHGFTVTSIREREGWNAIVCKE